MSTSQNVSFGNGYYYDPYMQTAATYTGGRVTEKATDSVFSGVASTAVIEGGIGFVGAAKKAKKEGKAVKSLFTDYSCSAKNSLKDVKFTKDFVLNKDTYKNLAKKGMQNSSVITAEKCIPTAEKMAKLSKEAQDAYKSASQYIKRAKDAASKGNEAARVASMEFAEKNLAKANALSAKNTISKTISNAATKSPTLAKAGKAVKASGAGFVAAIEGVIELFTNVVPTFMQLGPTKGLKQLGKSAVKVAGATAGWAGGFAVGAAIGSIIPGAGTVVGGIIGGIISTACGMVGSSLCSKLAEKFTGPSELEIAQQQSEEQQVPKQQTNSQPLVAQISQNQQNQASQPTYSTQSFASNPFAMYSTNSNVDFMDRDIMAMRRGYMC